MADVKKALVQCLTHEEDALIKKRVRYRCGTKDK